MRRWRLVYISRETGKRRTRAMTEVATDKYVIGRRGRRAGPEVSLVKVGPSMAVSLPAFVAAKVGFEDKSRAVILRHRDGLVVRRATQEEEEAGVTLSVHREGKRYFIRTKALTALGFAARSYEWRIEEDDKGATLLIVT